MLGAYLYHNDSDRFMTRKALDYQATEHDDGGAWFLWFEWMDYMSSLKDNYVNVLREEWIEERKKKLTASLMQSTKIFSGFICCLKSQHFCYFSSNQTYYTQFLQERHLLMPMYGPVILQLKNKWFLLLFYKIFTSNIWTRWLIISEKKIQSHS